MLVAQINDFSGVTYIHINTHKHIFLRNCIEISKAPNNTVVLLSINYYSQCGSHYGDKRPSAQSNTHIIWLGVQ